MSPMFGAWKDYISSSSIIIIIIIIDGLCPPTELAVYRSSLPLAGGLHRRIV